MRSGVGSHGESPALHSLSFYVRHNKYIKEKKSTLKIITYAIIINAHTLCVCVPFQCITQGVSQQVSVTSHTLKKIKLA